MHPDRVLRRPELLDRLSIGRSTLYAWIADGLFPRPIRIGKRAAGWRQSIVEDWLTRREATTVNFGAFR